MSKNFKAFKKKFVQVVVTATTLTAILATMIVNAQTVSQTTVNLNLRENSTTKSKVIKVIPKGQQVNIIQENGAWSKVEFNGKIGYVYNAYLRKTTVSKTGKVEVGSSRLNVRNKASIAGSIIGKLNTGDVVTIAGESGSWYKINYKGQTGYVSKAYVKTSSTTITEVEKCTDTFQATTGFSVKTNPSDSSTVIGNILKGQVFTVQGKCPNGWYQVKFGSKTGYISDKSLHKLAQGSTDPEVKGTAKINTKSSKSLNIRKGQGTGTASLELLPNGTKLEILNDSNPVDGWTRVRYNNLTGYAYTSYLELSVNPEVKDEAPVIDCISKIEMHVGDKLDLADLQVKVIDKEDGDITSKANIDTSNVDTSKAGNYIITVTAKDSKGNVSKVEIEVVVRERDVEPEENEAPKLSAQDVTITVGDKFDNSMLNIKATDKEDGDLAEQVKVEGTVNTEEAGVYELTISVADSKGETATIKVNVTVKEKEVPPTPAPEVNEAPKVTAKDVTLTVGDKFDNSMLNIKATDKEDDDATLKVDVKGDVKTNLAGVYTLTITVTDSKGATATTTAKVTVKEKENTPPTITAKDVTITQGDVFDKSMLQIKAEDAEDGILTSSVKIDGEVKTNTPGVYTLTLTVQDKGGLTATTTVKVTVKEKVNTAPTISAKDVTITEGDSFTRDLLQIKAEDAEDGDLSKDVVITGSVNAMKAGTYTLTLKVQDKGGLTATTTVTVTVKEKPVVKNEAPVISAQNVTVNVGGTFSNSMLNIQVTDKEDGTITQGIKVEGTVNTSRVGTYTLTISAQDSKGATATKTVTVTVKATAPVVSGQSVSIEEGGSLTDAMFKASATDCEGTSLAVSIDKSAVKTSQAGTYNVTITATDKWGNRGLKTVTVTVTAKAQQPTEQAYDINSAQGRAIVQQQMYALVNQLRASNGRPAYQVSGAMQNTAWIKSKDMGDKNYFDHTWNGQFIFEYTGAAEFVAENIAKTGFYPSVEGKITKSEAQKLAQTLFNMWNNSPGHKANMLDPECTSMGFDFYMVKGSTGYAVYATQEFDF